MVTFIEIPNECDTTIESTGTGAPFTETAIDLNPQYWVGTDAFPAKIYVAMVNGYIMFITQAANVFGYTYRLNDYRTNRFQPVATDYEGLLAVLTTVRIGVSDKLIGFNTVDEALSLFYETYIADAGDWIQVTVEGIPDDVYAEGGTSEPDTGGTGTFDGDSDRVPLPNMPTFNAANSGLISLFSPTLSELQSLGAYLWTHIGDFIENLQKLFTDPMSYIISLSVLPVVPETDTARNIYIGNWVTDIEMNPIKSQWFEFDCGSIRIEPYYGSALDYSPNTKARIMLPFIGSCDLDIDEIMGESLSLVYRIDLLSGECVACLSVNDNVLYQFTGECAVPIPLTGADWSRVYSAIAGAAGAIITGGMGAAFSGTAAGATTSAMAQNGAVNAAANAGNALANVATATKGMRGAPAMRAAMTEAVQAALTSADMAASAPSKVSNAVRATRLVNAISNTVGQVMGAKANVAHSGSISSAAGFLGLRTPYVMLTYPNQSLANEYKHLVGYPANLGSTLNNFTGYTECEQVIVYNIPGTEDELAEITEALKGGVYL